jgi:hypothetical protein
MCACAPGDNSCAQRVLDDMTKWGMEMAKKSNHDDRPDPDFAKRIEPVMARYTKCATAALTAPTPPAP